MYDCVVFVSFTNVCLQRLGGCEEIDADVALRAAESLAAESDVAIIVAGLSPEWESEGFDRPTLDMPGRQNELIARVGKANRNTVVCLQAVSGAFSPIMPGNKLNVA